MFPSITWQPILLVYILFQERIGLNGRNKVKEFITHLPALGLFSLCLNSFNDVMSFFKMSKWSRRWRRLAYNCIYEVLELRAGLHAGLREGLLAGLRVGLKAWGLSVFTPEMIPNWTANDHEPQIIPTSHIINPLLTKLVWLKMPDIFHFLESNSINMQRRTS